MYVFQIVIKEQVQEKGAIGVVVMNSPVNLYYDEYVDVDDTRSTEYNVQSLYISHGQITIPVVGTLFQNGLAILNLMTEYPNLTITISKDHECTCFPFL